MKRYKKWFYLIVFLCSCKMAKSQIFIGAGLGYDTKGSAISNLQMGYNRGLINLMAEVRPSLTRKVEMNNLLGFRLSANLVNPDEDGLSISPGIGYYYNHKSADKRTLNKWQYGYSLKTGMEITETGELFFECFYSDKSFQIEIGMQVNFK